MQNGSPNFAELIKIPAVNRIHEMAKTNPGETLGLVVAGLTLAVENMNLKRGMNASQLADLAEEIIDTSCEDKISFEDLMLFLQGLSRGRYGELYESMDMPKFMNFFNKYRDERWEEAIKIRDQHHEDFKNLGDPERSKQPSSALDQHMSDYTTKLQAKNDEIKLLRAERKKRWEQDNF